jgi:hypothetical protein
MKKQIHIDDMFFIRIHTAIKHKLSEVIYDELYYILMDDVINNTRRELRKHLANAIKNGG